MHFRPLAPLLLLTLAAGISGCAKDQDLYPSLSIRDAERVTGVFDPVAAEPYVPPAQSPQVLGRIDQLRADAQAAHKRFLGLAERARAPAAAARGAAVGSEQWAVAQIALGDLAAARSQTMVPLTELDLLFVAAQGEASVTTEIEQARAEVESLASAEDQLVDQLGGTPAS